MNNFPVTLDDAELDPLAIDFTEPWASYLLGLLISDGSHSGDLEGKGKVSIELAVRDENILHELDKRIPHNSSVRYRTRSTNFAEEYSSAILTVNSQSFRRQIAAQGIPPGPKSKHIPGPFGELRTRDVLRGLVDGDGSLGFTGAGHPFTSFVTASEALADYYRTEIALETWVTRNSKRNTRDGVFNIMYQKSDAVDVASWLYADGDIAIGRKAEAARKIRDAANEWPDSAKRTRRPWKPFDDDIVRNSTVKQAAKALGRSEHSVRMRRYRLTKLDTLLCVKG